MQSNDTLRKLLAGAKIPEDLEGENAYKTQATIEAMEKVLTLYLNTVVKHFTEVTGRELEVRLTEGLSYPLTSHAGKKVWAKKLAVKVKVKK